MRVPDRGLLFAAVLAIASVPVSQSVTTSLYHGIHTAHDILIGGIGFILFTAGLALLLGMADRFRNFPLKLFVCAYFFYNIYLLLRGHAFSEPVPPLAKAAAAAVFLGLFGFLFVRLDQHGWRKLSKAIIVTSSIFAVSAVLLASLAAPRPAPFGAPAFVRGGATHNYLFLILDETSPEYATGIVRGLERTGLHVKSTLVASSGKDTLNAIPGMLSRVRHDDVAPCSRSALCGTSAFNFSSLHADSSQTDVVGFYHPYCAIQGLRSCFRAVGVFASSSSLDFGLYGLWCAQFNRGSLFSFCVKDLPTTAALERAKKSMTEQIDLAPFWRQGGMLFVHFPLPHPSMTYDFASLKTEYEHNIPKAEKMVADLTARMMSTFGQDFTLVITTDHPLRIERWCASPKYSRPGCADGLPKNRALVPLIVASPGAIAGALPTTNVGLFSPAPAD